MEDQATRTLPKWTVLGAHNEQRRVRCDHCGMSFVTRKKDRRFCSDSCRVTHFQTDRPAVERRSNPNDTKASHLRRARKLGAVGMFTEDQVRQLYKAQRGKCFHCGLKLNGVFDRDHWIPLSRGGSNLISNIRLLCPPCNSSKYNKLPHEWCPEKYKPE